MTKFDEKRELKTWCKLILLCTKERVENNSPATQWIFDRLTREEIFLALFPKHLASKKAYEKFFKETGKDIRDYDWNSSVKTLNGEIMKVHQHYMDEHMTTAHDFKYEILSLFEKNELTIAKIKELISQQRLCWITKEEDKALSNHGFGQRREDPVEAYRIAGIEIYDKEHADLKNIMKPTFMKENLLAKGGKNLLFDQLEKYFADHTFDGKKFEFKPNQAYAWIYKKGPYMINLRLRGGLLKDVCLYIDGDKAKQIFAKLLLKKDEIENKLGYQLAWDKNQTKKAVRIGRFFEDADLSTTFELENQDKNFGYNLGIDNIVEKVACELVNFYNVFVPIIENFS